MKCKDCVNIKTILLAFEKKNIFAFAQSERPEESDRSCFKFKKK